MRPTRTWSISAAKIPPAAHELRMTDTLNIATRESPLAVWQADYVADRLRDNQPSLDVQLVKLSTRGDKILDQALSKVGGKDLFVKEIEHALLDGRAHVAVHSLKDMPTELPDGLQVTAYPPREDPRDAIVSTRGYTLDTLPFGAVVGTCSLRRAAQLLRRRPDLKIVPIRGNVQTRLKKLDAEGMDATMLAFAGLKRLEMPHLATHVLSSEECLPAIGQGILAVETKVDDPTTNGHVDALDDDTARSVPRQSERSCIGFRAAAKCRSRATRRSATAGCLCGGWSRASTAKTSSKTLSKGRRAMRLRLEKASPKTCWAAAPARFSLP